MRTWMPCVEALSLRRVTAFDRNADHEAEGLTEPECWQLEDFEDIVPKGLAAFDGEYDTGTPDRY